MEILLRRSWKLTDEHPDSTNGIPVLANRLNNHAYRPGDVLRPYSSWDYVNGRVAVHRMLKTVQLDHVERAFVSKFGLSRHTHLRQARKTSHYGYVKSQYKSQHFPRWEL